MFGTQIFYTIFYRSFKHFVIVRKLQLYYWVETQRLNNCSTEENVYLQQNENLRYTGILKTIHLFKKNA